ncbi:MAG TPA: hypothetical protein VEP90_30530 [Methylomirabilota bacterium]|nr:hypothetical protein [Methylomirabilota bacterium]
MENWGRLLFRILIRIVGLVLFYYFFSRLINKQKQPLKTTEEVANPLSV